MNSFELNKIAGAVCVAALFIVGLGIGTDTLFTTKKPEIAGYDLPMPQKETASATKEAPPPAEPLPVLLAKADVSRGQSAAKKCASCHSFEKGGANKVGPNLWNVVGAPSAHIQGFSYSAAMKERAAKGGKWGFEDIYAFLLNPKGYLPGTSMGFAGIPAAQERADIVSYLHSLSDSPLELPKP